ncbi:MAG: radical SAM family heme chaperone HemW [Firmicutes bacterium]|jgi:oxygen-independent coproporphyrinogen-3 oxidase|nr:radical SAM family heme chaperone HemW [Bacillota bacterium]
MSSGGSIYVHVPFCASKCSYCDFVSVPLGQVRPLAASYLAALRTELRPSVRLLRRIAPIRSIYIGGGTPTALPASELARLASELLTAAVSAAAGDDPVDIEFTVEANPATIDTAGLSLLLRAGVNRLSLGVQSLDPAELEALGRAHDAAQALAAIDDARAAGFENLNVDLIIGAPGQTRASLECTLESIVARRPDHVSAYCLQLETGTPLERAVASGKVQVPDADETADLYWTAVRALCSAGYRRYEVSNFALPGRECRHNLGYWECGMYLGLGAAAHSHYPSEAGGPARRWVRSWNTSDVGEYVRLVMSGHTPEAGREELDAEREARDRVMLGLRTERGVDLAEVGAAYGVRISDALLPVLRKWSLKRMVEMEGTRARIAPQAALVANVVLAECV